MSWSKGCWYMFWAGGEIGDLHAVGTENDLGYLECYTSRPRRDGSPGIGWGFSIGEVRHAVATGDYGVIWDRVERCPGNVNRGCTDRGCDVFAEKVFKDFNEMIDEEIAESGVLALTGLQRLVRDSNRTGAAWRRECELRVQAYFRKTGADKNAAS